MNFNAFFLFAIAAATGAVASADACLPNGCKSYLQFLLP